MDSDDRLGRRRVLIPSFLRRSGIKIKGNPGQDESSRSCSAGSEAATQGLGPHSHQPVAFKPRSFLNAIVTTSPTRRRDPLDGKMDDARQPRTDSDNASRSIKPGEDSSHGHSTGGEEVSQDDSSDDGSRTLTPDSTDAGDAEGATSATAQLEQSRAMAAYEVAHEYQKRVERGEAQAPTDQDRANYVNWKRSYMAWQAQKQRESED
ncbi:hypothetical protein SLS54_002581 [Diplodia seriata]